MEEHREKGSSRRASDRRGEHRRSEHRRKSNIDVDNERFSLGIKQLTDDPWETLPKRFPRGTKVNGVIKKMRLLLFFLEQQI